MTRAGMKMLSLLALGACVTEADPDGGAENQVNGTVVVLDGRYDLRREACGDANSSTALRVRGDSFRFYESDCVYGRRGGQPGAAEGTLICMAEGQRFTRAIRLEIGFEQLRMVEGGIARDYLRCPSV